ncbi:MAG: hypothetical protein II217_05425, partial [Alistipes sp.]|nr:hypothetical protein [Alistipes sp.]
AELKDIVNMTQITMDETATAVIDGETILQMRKLASTVPVMDEIMEYTMRLISQCPNDKWVSVRS